MIHPAITPTNITKGDNMYIQMYSFFFSDIISSNCFRQSLQIRKYRKTKIPNEIAIIAI